MPTPDATPPRFAQTIRSDITRRTAESDGRKVVVFRKVRTVFLDAGRWRKRGSSNVGEIVDALVAEEVHWDRDLSTSDFDDYVCFSLDSIPSRVPAATLTSEKVLSKYIQANYRALFERLRDLAGLELVAAEVEYQRTRSEQRPDLLFTDSTGRSVVIELEVGDPQENSAFQILKYMNATDARLGVLITARPSDELLERNTREMLALMGSKKPNLWLIYNVRKSDGRLTLRPVK